MVWKTWYTNTFYKHIMLRHSCAKCPFCNTHRPSDITLADFWGWQKQDAEINKDDKGLNLVLVNTPKGREIWEAIKDELEVIDARPEAYMQPNLQHPSQPHRLRKQFERDYKRHGFDYVFRQPYPDKPLWQRLCDRASSLWNRAIRKIRRVITI